MALTREFLSGLGLDKEVLDKVMAESGKTITELSQAQAKLSEAQASIESYKKTAEDQSKQLKDLKAAAGDNDDLKAKVDDLTTSLKEAEDKRTQSVNEVRIESAVDMALVKAGALNTKAARALLDDDKITVDKDGKVTGIDDQLTKVKEDNSFLFKSEDDGQGGQGGQGVIHATSGNVGGQSTDTGKITSSMTYEQAAAALSKQE